jgi:hypothetical protein
MFKQSVFSVSGFLASGIVSVLMATPASAIVEGADKIGACGNFTASKYGVPGNQITVKIDRRALLGYFLSWSVQPYRASGYCFVTNGNRTTQWVVQRGPRPEDIAKPTLGVNEKSFILPSYGNVIVNRGQAASGDKQYFLVRPVRGGQDLKWYARCDNNSDQVYDHNGKYVGSDSKMTVMFSYVCEVSSLKPKPTAKPQPR